jgi:predicted unusual protein kinase regulating ubiquinone biosynthesis (AarF/ABC1/UbiB family)
MTWKVVLGVVAVVVVFSVAHPTTRRVWAFHWFAAKRLLLWLLDVMHIRRRGYTRPILMRRFAEDMGPTFIKFGQIVASSSGMFPKPYVDEFRKCLDRVRPFSFDEVERILGEELGKGRRRLARVEPSPLASASIAQVHAATLDDGTEVVVKVQRPHIQERCAADMRVMRAAAVVAEKLIKDAELASPVAIVEDFAATLREELDFRKEAANLERFNEIMAGLGYRDVHAPRPFRPLTTERVLTMSRFRGVRVDDVEAVKKSGVDAEERLVHGLKAWFQCVLFHGFFHGDVHAGNLMLLDDRSLGFLDFGIVGRFDARQMRMVTDYIVAFVSADWAGLARVIADMGGVKDSIDMKAFSRDLESAYSPLLKMSFSEINYADMIPQIHRVATKHRMRMPKEFVLITKQMLYFDRYAKLLAPKLNVFTDPRLVASLFADLQKVRAAQAAAT